MQRFDAIHGPAHNAAMFASITPKPFTQCSSAEFGLIMQINARGLPESIIARQDALPERKGPT